MCTFSLDGFFDAGMLLQALKARDEREPAKKAASSSHTRKAVGKRLRLSEY